MIEIRVLGPLEVVDGGGRVSLGGRMQRLLLASLVARRGESVTGDWLVDALWPDAPPPSAPKLVQVYVSGLRKRLPASIRIETGAAGYLLECPPSTLDAVLFEQLLDSARAEIDRSHPARIARLLERALGVWRGAAYGELAEEPVIMPEAARLDALRLTAIERRNEARLAMGQHRDLLPDLLELAERYPLRERLQAQAMLALYRSGRQSEALAHYLTARRRLREELGVEPGEELETVQLKILRHDPALLAAEPGDSAARSLPTAPNVLVGRRRELRELRDLLLDDEVRLLALVGAGGSGKTRLALEAARAAAASFANGVAFVDLTPVQDVALVPEALARAVGASGPADDPLEAVAEFLAPREQLVVIDNAEHLRPAGVMFARLLTKAPHVKLLVTSRVVLHVRGEQVYPVDPLPEEDAAALFARRTREADPGLSLGAGDLDAVLRICRRLDGLPLAIELAASRVRTLAVQELAERLDTGLPTLAGGPQDLPARQRTLRATIEWSYRLLGPRERRLLALLAVFTGPFSLDAAEQVVGIGVDELQTLVEHSLVQRRAGRFVLLETIRQFTAEQLRRTKDRELVRRRHAEFYRSVADAAGLVWESELPQRYQLVVGDQDNLRAAIDWAAGRDHTLAIEIATSLEAFWATVSPLEGVRVLGSLMTDARGLDPALQARGLRVWGAALYRSGERGAGTARYRESLRVYRQLGDERGAGGVLSRLAVSELDAGDLTSARQQAEESLDLLRRSRFAKGESVALAALGEITFRQGDHDRGLAMLEKSAAMAASVGFAWWQAQASFKLAELTRSVGRIDDADRWCLEVLRISNDLGDRILGLYGLALLSAIRAERGDGLMAARLWGAVELEEANRPLPGQDWPRARDGYAASALSDGRPEAMQARLEGRRLTLEQAIALTVSVAPARR